MAKFRIKRTSDFYTVQKKGILFWSNPFRNFRHQYSIPMRFETYDHAKQFLETQINFDKKMEEYKRARKQFKTRYYYPPLADKEPEDA